MKLKSLIFFIIFIKAAPTIYDHYFTGQLSQEDINKCFNKDFPKKKETTAECIAKTSLIQPKGEYDPKCCQISAIRDPIPYYKEIYRENWKKIVSQKYGYDLNISEEELRKKLIKSQKENGSIGPLCQFTNNIIRNAILYQISLSSLDGEVKYDCGEGEKIFKRKDYHPTNKDDIIDKEMLDSTLEYTEKNCLKRGKKLSGDDYQVCWCQRIPLSSVDTNDKRCIPFKISNFEERLKYDMNIVKKSNMKIEFKCNCLNNKGKTIKGRYNSITGEVKVE